MESNSDDEEESEEDYSDLAPNLNRACGPRHVAVSDEDTDTDSEPSDEEDIEDSTDRKPPSPVQR